MAAQRESWQSRARAGRGGGSEYHLASLPAQTKAALILAARPAIVATPTPSVEIQTAWADFERKRDTHKSEARRRFDALVAVERLIEHGTAKLDAYATVAQQLGESPSTIRNWRRLVKGAHQGDWLPLLVPRYVGRTVGAEYPDEIYQLFRDQYLHPSKPPASLCYERVSRIAEEKGWAVPSCATLRRRLEREEDQHVITLEREGERALAAKFPYLERKRAAYHAMQALNADGHNLDVAVRWEDGEEVRATLIAFQDLKSGMVVGYRLAKSESAHEIGLAFLDVCDRHGVCEHLYVDNTLAMASKRMTGGALHRRRFKDMPGDPLGVMPTLGVQVHFTTPAHGQSKPIERAFRELADRISKHPAFTGAYLGRNTQAKPSNYGERVVPIEQLRPIVEQEVRAFNAKPGRRTEAGAGVLSFAQAFDASYLEHGSLIRRLDARQRRLLYLVAESVTVDRRDSCVKVFGNRYWSEQLAPLAGKKVVVRYHPTERTLHDAVHVYRLDGTYIGEVPCYEAAGYADADAAQRHGRARRQFERTKKDLAKTQRRLDAAEIAAMVPALRPDVAPDGAVVRRDFTLPREMEDALATQSAEVSRSEREAREERMADLVSDLTAPSISEMRRRPA